MFDAAWEMLPRLLDGLQRTVFVLFACALLSLPLALALSLAQLSGYRLLRWTSQFYVFIFRGIPALVQLFFVYYGFSMSETLRATWAWYFFQSAWFCGIFALTLNTTAYQVVIFRGALLAVPGNLLDAARALGLSRRQVFWLVHLPGAFRLALPAYGIELVLLAKATSIVSTITILDLLGMAKLIYTETFDPFTPLLTAAALYLVLVWTIQSAITGMERWLLPHMRDRRTDSGMAAATQAH
jgi:His/Glu/Gln/Arg/opine family amino acid ABC transporter permease subunit